ncbi:MAG: LssY C-terminal domain-containing protein, partial [Chloroflexota bacterium]|nr:LssY C-terminal domain-containing protein [Chloroflexota bacterium]
MWALPLAVLALCLLGIGTVRWYPYQLAFPTFPRTTRTHAGVAGDPINLVFVGSQDQISRSFLQAGWLVPDPITAQTSAAIVAASIAHRAYP